MAEKILTSRAALVGERKKVTERAELARLTGDEATRERELREAHRLFTEIGAPLRAAEVAKELGP